MKKVSSFALILMVLTSCNAKGNKTGEMNSNTLNTPTAEPAVVYQPSAEEQKWKDEPGLYAEFVTSKGTIVCKLEYTKAPVTVASFVGLAEGKIKNTAKSEGTHYFDGLTFHGASILHNPL